MSALKEGQFPVLRGRVVKSTGILCPLCEREGNRNAGGNTPRLVGLDGDLLCMGRHGKVADETPGQPAP